VLQQLADGRWLLYSIGNSSSAKPPRTDCAGGYSPRTYACARVAALQASLHPYSPLLVCGVALACCYGWHVIVCFTHGHTAVERTGNAFVAAIPDEVYLTAGRALGPEANWTRVPVDINPQLGHAGQHGDGGDINPAPLVFANGSVVMMWRGGDHWYDVHLAHSSDWATGPYNSSLSGSVRPYTYGCRHTSMLRFANRETERQKSCAFYRDKLATAVVKVLASVATVWPEQCFTNINTQHHGTIVRRSSVCLMKDERKADT
jgi:hypothetical protein